MAGKRDGSTDDKAKKVVEIVKLLRQKGISSVNKSFAKARFCEFLKKKNKNFSHLEPPTIQKWMNISLGFVHRDMQKALDLCVDLCEQGRGGGMVWDVVERRSFVDLTCLEKIFVFRGMSSKHLYRITLSARLRDNAKRSNNDSDEDPIPEGTGSADKVTRWNADECHVLIDQAKQLVAIASKFAERNNITKEMLTEAEMELEDEKTSHGAAGIFGILFREVPATESSRVPKYSLNRHKSLMLEALAKFNSDRGIHTSFLEGDETQSDSTDSIENLQPLQKHIPPTQKHTKRKTVPPTKILQSNTNIERPFVGGKAPRKVPTRESSDIEDGEIRENDAVNTESFEDEILASGHASSIPSEVRHTPVSNSPNNPSNTVQPITKEGSSDVIRRSSRIRRREPLQLENDDLFDDESGANEEGQPPVQRPRLVDKDGTEPAVNAIIERNNEEEDSNRPCLVDLDEGDEQLNEGPLDFPLLQQPNSAGVTSLLGRIFEEHEKAIETMIEQDRNNCIPLKLRRIDDTIDRIDMKHEVFPLALAPTSVGRQLGIRVVQDLQSVLKDYVIQTFLGIAGQEAEEQWGLVPRFDKISQKLYYKGMRDQLENRGFVVFENLLRHEGSSSRMDVDGVFEFVEDNFRKFPVTQCRRIETERERDPKKLWINILNNNTIGRTTLPPDQCRYQTWPWKLEDGLPIEVSKKKAAIDIQLGNLLQKMFETSEENDPRVRHFAFPKYGSIFLRTCENTKAQLPHCDFPPVEPEGLLPFHEPPPLHDLFLMYSGKQAFAIRIWHNSHTTMNVDTSNPSTLHAAAERMASKLEIVPPYSVLIGRGDLIHAGASGEEVRMAFGDYKGTTTKDKKKGKNIFTQCGNFGYNTRGHLYATRGTYTFDGVFRTPPDFPASINDDNM